MCEFCENEDLTEICCKTVDFGVLGEADLTIDISRNYIYANLCSKGHSQISIELKRDIRFCPICGRDLRSEENE